MEWVCLDLCSGAFFARDDESRSGMIDGGLSSVSVFRLSFCVFLADGVLSLAFVFGSYAYRSFLSLIDKQTLLRDQIEQDPQAQTSGRQVRHPVREEEDERSANAVWRPRENPRPLT